MNASLAALAYLVSGVLFILSLRGLSSPETSRQGNIFGGFMVTRRMLAMYKKKERPAKVEAAKA